MLETITLGAAGAAGAYALYRLVAGTRGQKREMAEISDNQAPDPKLYSGGPYRPPHGVPVSTTYGDAQFANARRDGARMRDILGNGRGIWFGQEAAVSGAGVPHDKLRDMDYCGERHLLTVAPTGSGKGACAIIPNLLLQNELSIICIDPKGQAAAVTHRCRARGGKRVHFLNPFNEHGLGTSCFNPLAELRIDSPDVVKNVGRLAEALILTEGRDPYFDNTARDLVKVLILHLIETKGGAATLPDMRRLLTLLSREDEEAKALLTALSRSPYSFIAQPAARFGKDSRDIKSATNTAITQTGFVDDPLIAHTLGCSDFSMLDFKDRPTTLYIILPAVDIAHYAAYFRLVVVSAINHLMSRPGGTRTLLMLDEFTSLGRLPTIENAITQARGYNVQLWPFVQNLSLLREVYKEGWEMFLGNAGVVQWFTPADIFTAQYLSRLIGKTTVSTETRNSQTSLSESSSRGGPSMSGSKSSSSTDGEAGVDFLSPQDLFDIPSYYQILTLAGLKYPILCTREAYYNWGGPLGPIRELADPDPFHLSQDVAPKPVGMPSVFPAKAGEQSMQTIARPTDKPFDLHIIAEDTASDVNSFGWFEPLRVMQGGQECPALMGREAMVRSVNGQPMFIFRTLAENLAMVQAAFPLVELLGFETRRVGDLRIPRDYKVFNDQVIKPDDHAVCAVTAEFLWPLATTCARPQEVEELRARLTRHFLGGAQPAAASTKAA